jgi:hypothetical protein
MSRRSPFNKRYQNQSSESSGSTRKSAASAKIKRTSSSKSAPKKPQTRREKLLANARARQTGAKKPAQRSGSRLAVVPDTPEYKRLRRIWWILLGIAVVALVVALLLNNKSIIAAWPPAGYVSLGFEIVAIGLIAATWILDFRKIRPLVKQAQKEARSGKKKTRS